MKWPQIIFVLVAMAGVILAVLLRDEKPVVVPAPPARAAPVFGAGRVLPPATEQPGVTSRLIGLLRTYIAVPDEIRLEPSVELPAARVAAIPILLVFENETYRPLIAADVGFLGSALCTVRIARVPERGAEVEVFQTEVPLPSRADWLSAERRSFSVEWPMREEGAEVVAGQYRITVRLALPEEPAVEIYTRLL